MFWSKRIPPMDINRIQATSKMSLKMSCLAACNNNVEEAQKLYDFIASDINLPDTDVMPPSAIERFKSGAEGLMGWIGEHKESLIEGYNMIQMIRGGQPILSGAPAAPPAGVQPLP